MPIKNKLVIIDGALNNVVEREMTKEELHELNSQQIDPDKQISQADAKATAKAAILDRIGLTADELKTILG